MNRQWLYAKQPVGKIGPDTFEWRETAIPEPRAAKYHTSDAELSVTRIVHASVVIEIGGERVLIDPWFHSGFFVRQREALGLVPDTLPSVSLVLITGDTPEQFDPLALAYFVQKPPPIVAPPRLLQRLTELGFPDVRALTAWDTTTIHALTVTALPTSRGARENGYLLAGPTASAYVAGDTRAFPSLVDIATAFPAVDVALLPIGGERLMGFTHQMPPREAAEAATLLKPRYVIPIAYGAANFPPFWWSDANAVDDFTTAAVANGIPRDRVVPLEPGESWHYYPTAAR